MTVFALCGTTEGGLRLSGIPIQEFLNPRHWRGFPAENYWNTSWILGFWLSTLWKLASPETASRACSPSPGCALAYRRNANKLAK